MRFSFIYFLHFRKFSISADLIYAHSSLVRFTFFFYHQHPYSKQSIHTFCISPSDLQHRITKNTSMTAILMDNLYSELNRNTIKRSNWTVNCPIQSFRMFLHTKMLSIVHNIHYRMDDDDKNRKKKKKTKWKAKKEKKNINRSFKWSSFYGGKPILFRAFQLRRILSEKRSSKTSLCYSYVYKAHGV